MAATYNDWAATTTYVVDELANYNGVVYRALNAITGNATNQNPCLDTTNWIVAFVIRAQDRNGVIEAVKQELNIDDDMINNSIPFYLQLAESSFYTRVRPPTTLKSEFRTIQTISAPAGYENRQYLSIPADLLNVENMRVNENGNSSGILGLGSLEIKAAASDYDFEVLRSYYQGDDYFFGGRQLSNFNGPLYRFQNIGGSPYFEIAPAQYPANTQVEIRYYQSEPALGTIHPQVNAAGQPVNSAGQTLAEWEADGNDASTFVQNMVTIDRNWFTANAPHLLIYGTLTKAASYLKDDDRAAMWEEQFRKAEAETIDLIYRFEEVRPVDIQMGSVYAL